MVRTRRRANVMAVARSRLHAHATARGLARWTTRARTAGVARDRARASRASSREDDATTRDDSVVTETDATAPERRGRFVRASPSASSPSAPLGSGPGDVGTSGSAPPTMNIKVIPLETTRFQGVAKATEAESEDEVQFRRGQLIAGDALALVVFAAIGRANHGEGSGVVEALATAAPFALGWFGAGTLMNAYGDDARGSDGSKAAVVAAKTWAIGIPAGLALRALGKGAAPPTPFIAVSMVVTAAFLVGWRYAFARNKAPIGKNKRGNPLEFISLLSSLVKRW